MCGIAGWIGNDSSEVPSFIGTMQTALHDRGPDAIGLWRNDRAVLAHTRLSIIDIDGSAQPMSNEDGTVIVTFNGEIYNYRRLRSSLLAAGHTFKSDGDTEVLVHLYEERGCEMVDSLDGMFAFGIYDSRKHSFLLARDRVGIKPLYYWHSLGTGELLFASDMNAMLANPMLPRRLNQQVLSQYLHFGYAIHPRTWLDQVYQLEPGEVLEWRNGRILRRKYYQWRYEPKGELESSQASSSGLREKLSASVGSQLVADVPLGSFLSGGLDSTTSTAMAQQARRESGSAIDSFTVRFWDEAHDESPRARAIARDLGTNHTEIDAQQLQLTNDLVVDLVKGLGEPFGDSSALAVYLLCSAARPYVKVALSGDGGDELFLGYTGLIKQRLARRLRRLPQSLRRLGRAATAESKADLPRRLNKYMNLSLHDDAGLILEWSRRWGAEDLYSLLGTDLFATLFPANEERFPEVRKLIGKGETGGFEEQQIRFHLLVDLPCDCLFKTDRMSMAHGLEVRVPMLSNDMLQYASALPLHMRSQNKRTKEPLRTLAESLSGTIAQPAAKHGFSFPLDLWMRGKIGRYWRDRSVTLALSRIGLQACAIDSLVTRYESLDGEPRSYQSQYLSARLYDLLLLGVWADTHRVCA